jgi:hypothetical protein
MLELNPGRLLTNDDALFSSLCDSRVWFKNSSVYKETSDSGRDTNY